MSHDVIVVGAGNAALCAALSAHEGGARVLVLEKAPEEEKGGNSYFTAGGFRFAHDGLEDVRKDILDDLSEAEAVGGLFYENYPGGSGLMAGSVFGKLAGQHAAAFVKQSNSAAMAAG